MLSEKKSVLRFAELIAIAASLSAWFLAFSTWEAPPVDFPVSLWAIVGMTVMMLTFGPACYLSGEYAKAAKKPIAFRNTGLNSEDISFITRWAPSSYKVAAIIAVLVMLAVSFKLGRIRFSEDHSADPEKIPGMFLGLSGFYLIALPILGSAARMPGSYVSALARLKASERRSRALKSDDA